MSSIEKKKFIIDNLISIKGINNYLTHYKYILNLVKNNNINITKNKRGYYFNLNSLDDSVIEHIYEYIKNIEEIN